MSSIGEGWSGEGETKSEPKFKRMQDVLSVLNGSKGHFTRSAGMVGTFEIEQVSTESYCNMNRAHTLIGSVQVPPPG